MSDDVPDTLRALLACFHWDRLLDEEAEEDEQAEPAARVGTELSS